MKEISIKNIEYQLASKKESNEALGNENPEWRMDAIEAKTGIKLRHTSEEDETAMDLAISAANKLFKNGIVSRDKVDGLIYITQSPHHILPSSACVIQDELGLPTSCMAFDVNLGCSGFVYGLGIAGSLLQSEVTSNVLLICSDTYTKYIRKDDRTCRPLFSDGAAACMIMPCNESRVGPFLFGTDGSGASGLIVETNTTTSDCGEYLTAVNELYMDGSKVFMFTMDRVPKKINKLLTNNNMTINDIDLFIFHQASKLVIDNIARHLKIPDKKIFRNYEYIGNTVSASIPIAIKDALDNNQIKRGDRILLAGFGVGLSVGVTIIEW